MADIELGERLAALQTTMGSIEAVLDLPALREQVVDLEAQASAPDLWDDQERAQQVTSRLSFVQGELRKVGALRSRLDDLPVLFELAQDEGDEAALADALAELESVQAAIDEMEVRTLLSGEYDSREAFVTIRSGAGGVDAADWAEMLLRMYLRWAEARGFDATVQDRLDGQEAGIKSATFTLSGPNAYGLMSAERGVHRLVRLSPFDSANRRQTSVAAVQVAPLVTDEAEVEIEDKDIRIDTYRASGAGGQHVNKTDSAVRITHLPTGVVVQCQNERSQTQNRATAMNMLRSRLLELELQKREEEAARERGESMTIGFGSQIRSYVIHPYSMVKDLRTGHETGNTQAVFDGALDPFMRAELERRAKGLAIVGED